MAKKKAKKTRRGRSRSRRRVSGIGGGIPFEQAGMALAGGLGGRMITNVARNVKALEGKEKLLIAIKAGIGVYGLTMKNETVRNLSMGLLGETALHAAGEFAPNQFGAKQNLAGVGSVVIDLDDDISGMSPDYGVAGMNDDDLAVAGVY